MKVGAAQAAPRPDQDRSDGSTRPGWRPTAGQLLQARLTLNEGLPLPPRWYRLLHGERGDALLASANAEGRP